MKKICFITTVPGTIRAFIIDLAVYLHNKDGFDISFICDYDASFARSLPQYIHYYPVRMQRGISIGGIKAIFEIRKIFKREHFDLVQYSTPNASCYAAMAARSANIPVRLYCQWGIAYVGFHGIKRKIFKFIEKVVCCLSTWIEPDSRGNLVFSHAEGLYPDSKGSVIWNGSASGVSIEKFDITQREIWRKHIREQYDIPQEATVFCFVGRITGDKGINELFQAFRCLTEKYNDSRLLLVGRPEKVESVSQELYSWAEQSQNVIFCGSSNVVEQYLSACDIYVLPSYREGFGGTIIEAEAMGRPVIVTDIPGPTDAMKKDVTGLVVKKADADALYQAMERLYEEKDLRQIMGDAAFEWATTRFEQQELFRHILEDRKRLLGE